MARDIRVPGLLLATLLVLSSGCGSDTAETAVPTAEALASNLVAVGDYPGDWNVNLPPDVSEAGAAGVITDDEREMLPSFELCPAASAESSAAADSLEWMAFRQLDLTVDDPIEPPDRTGHLIFSQEYLA